MSLKLLFFCSILGVAFGRVINDKFNIALSIMDSEPPTMDTSALYDAQQDFQASLQARLQKFVKEFKDGKAAHDEKTNEVKKKISDLKELGLELVKMILGSKDVKLDKLVTEVEKARAMKQDAEDQLDILKTENEKFIRDISSVHNLIELPANLDMDPAHRETRSETYLGI